MPSKNILYEAYWQDVQRRCLKADEAAMHQRRAARTKNERAARPCIEAAERLERRAERLDSLGVKIVGRLFRER